MKLILDRIVSVVSLLVAVGLLSGGCKSASDPGFTSAPIIDTTGSAGSRLPEGTNSGVLQSPDRGYPFQVGDMIGVLFSGTAQEIPAHGERIKEDGNITLPLIGAVKAAGKTAGELQKEIHALYVPKYYVRLTVNVNPPAQDLVFYVTGEVRVPGPKPYNISGMTVTQGISAAGGPTDYGRKGRVELKRANGTKVRIDYDKAVRDPKLDPKIFPGDSINVPRRPI
jgi:protein involved in polysaccharide export with SLBB domain